MATPQPAIQIFTAVANGTHDWAFGAGPSHLYKSRLRLVSATFTGNIFLDGWDIHIRKNRAGTTTEFV